MCLQTWAVCVCVCVCERERYEHTCVVHTHTNTVVENRLCVTQSQLNVFWLWHHIIITHQLPNTSHHPNRASPLHSSAKYIFNYWSVRVTSGHWKLFWTLTQGASVWLTMVKEMSEWREFIKVCCRGRSHSVGLESGAGFEAASTPAEWTQLG